MCNIRIGSMRGQMPEFLSDGNNNFALSLSIYEMFANLIKCQNFNFENEGNGRGSRKWDSRHWTGNDRFHIGDFIRILALWEHTFTQRHTYTHNERQSADYRQNLKSDLPKKEWKLPHNQSLKT